HHHPRTLPASSSRRARHVPARAPCASAVCSSHRLCHQRFHRARAAAKRPKTHSSVTPTSPHAHPPPPPHTHRGHRPAGPRRGRPCNHRAVGPQGAAAGPPAPPPGGRRGETAENAQPPYTHHRHRTLTAATARRARGVAARAPTASTVHSPHRLCHQRVHRARAAAKRPKTHSSITPTTATAHSPRPPHGGPEAWPPESVERAGQIATGGEDLGIARIEQLEQLDQPAADLGAVIAGRAFDQIDQ